jgi:hypothetical protein
MTKATATASGQPVDALGDSGDIAEYTNPPSKEPKSPAPKSKEAAGEI